MSLTKRPRVEAGPGAGAAPLEVGAVLRTSSLVSPNVQLTGHAKEVLAVDFDPSGQYVASASADTTIFLWNAGGDNSNFGVVEGHKAAVLDVQWSRDSRQLLSCSADSTVGTWDVTTGQRVRKHIGHDDIVNSIDVVRRGLELVVSASDDGSVAVWDPREKEAVSYFYTSQLSAAERPDPVLSVAVDSVGSQVYSAGTDGEISVWDPRQHSTPLYVLPGHSDATVTGLRVSPDDNYLLSNGTDSTVRTWDIRPFAPPDRALNVYDGAPHGVEVNLLRPAWSKDGSKIAAGSADRSVVIWDAASRRILYKLPGHIGAVTGVAFSPKEPIIASASADATVILGEFR